MESCEGPLSFNSRGIQTLAVPFSKLSASFFDCSGPEERERKRQVTEPVGVGGSEWGEEKTPLIGSPVAEISDDQTAVLERHQDGDSPDLFLQKPFAASPGLDHFSPNVLIATPTPPLTNNAPPSSPAGRSPWMICSPQSFLQEEQFSKMMAEGSNQWFSVLPRSPCDDESVTSCSSPADSASSPVPVITSSSSALTYGQFGTVAPPGIKSTHLPISQVSGCSCILQCKIFTQDEVCTGKWDFTRFSATSSHWHKLEQQKLK